MEPSPPPSAAGPPTGSEEPPVPPELPVTPPSWPALDRLGLTQAIGGLALGLIALFSSNDHLTFTGRNIPIPQQWGIPLIAASVAIIVVDAQLATGSRLRAADEEARERDLAAEARKRKRESLERLHQTTVLSARVQLVPSGINRARLKTFLALLNQTPGPASVP